VSLGIFAFIIKFRARRVTSTNRSPHRATSGRSCLGRTASVMEAFCISDAGCRTVLVLETGKKIPLSSGR